MCEYTSTRAAAVQTFTQPPSLFSNKTHPHMQTYKARLSSTQTASLSVHSVRLFPSEPFANRHTCGQILPHIERGLFSLYVVMPVNLLTGTANRGNLPSCSCVLRETLETVETADSISLTFSLWLRWQKSWPLREEEMRQSRAMPKILPHQSHSGPLKGTNKTHGTIIGPGLWKSILLLTWGASTKAISYSSFYTRFLTKKTFNFRTVWTIDFTATIHSPPPPPSVLSLL